MQRFALIAFSFALVSVCSATIKGYTDNGRPPVLVMHGLASSAMEYKEKPQANDDDSGWERLWINPTHMANERRIFEDMSLHYDAASHSFTNRSGLSIRPIAFGNVEGIDYMTREFGIPIPKTDLYETFLQTLKNEGNYTLNVNVRSATWDWRMAANHRQMIPYWHKVDALIEEMYNLNQRKVVITCHCFGCPSMAWHLNRKSQDWKDKFIGTFVNMAPSFQGSIDMLKGVLVGHDEGFEIFGISLLNLEYVRNFLRTTGTGGALMPQKGLVGEDPIAITPSRKYYLNDLEELLKLVGANNTYDIYKDTRDMEDISAPNVPVLCIFGTGTATPIQLTFPTDEIRSDRKVLPVFSKHGDGDGTVPRTAATVCDRWAKQQSKTVDTIEWQGITHRAFVNKKDIASYLVKNVLLHN